MRANREKQSTGSQVNARKKPFIAAAAFLLLALGILLRPSEQRPAMDSAGPAERARSVSRPPRPPGDSRRAKGFGSFFERTGKAEFPEPTRREIDVYLEAQHRSAGSLLAAFRLTDDEALLAEALEKFPHDPEVLLTSLRRDGDPVRRLAILESFKQADPGNGIGYCLAARVLFDLGKTDEAFAELSQGLGKPINDLTKDSCQNTEEAYLAAGFSPAEAKMSAMAQSSKQLLLEFRNLADHLQAQRKSDASAGNLEAVQASRDIQMEIASRLQDGGFVVDQLVAMVVEKGVLKEIDSPETQARLDEMAEQKETMSEEVARIEALLKSSTVPEGDWLLYFDRVKLFGERAATRWMLGKYPDP